MAGSAWTNQVVNAIVAGGTGNGVGLFLYNGTPAAGNPPIFTAVPPGTTKDPFGNTVSPIVNIGSLSSNHVGFDSNGVEYLADATGTPRIVIDPIHSLYEVLQPGGLGTAPLLTVSPTSGTDNFGQAFQAGFVSYTSATTYAQLTSALLQFANALTTSAGFIGLSPSITATLELTSPKSAAGDTVLQLALIPSGVGTPTAAVNRIQAWQPGSAGTTVEGWNSLGTLANYTVTAGRYRMTAEGEVEFDIDVASAGANAASTTFANTLPAAYRRADSRTYPLASNLAIASMTSLPRLGITAAGAVSVSQTATVTTSVVGQAFMPLD